MQFVCYHNGAFLPQNETFLPTTILGFTRGYAAFELIRTYGYTPFYLTEHLDRLKKNAKALLLHYPETIEALVFTLLEKNDCPNLVIRIYLSEDESGKSHTLILCDPITPPPEEHYQKGIPIITTSLTRHFYQIKSTCYLAAIIALKEAAKQNAEDALFIDSENNLLELTKSNFFAVINGTLYTPKEGMLFGITRAIIINLANELSIPVREEPIPYSKISSMDEAFSSSTIRELLPISSINGIKIPLGPITKKLHEAFLQSFLCCSGHPALKTL